MRRKLSYDYIILLAVFLIVIFFVILNLLTGAAWTLVSETQMAMWIIVASTFGGAVGAVVATYSFIAYMEKPELRFLVLALVGIDVIFIMFAFMFTHHSLLTWIPLYPEHQKNRTIIAIFGLTLIPSALSSSFRGDAPVLGARRWLIMLLGGLVLPATVIWFALSPEAVFLTVDPTGGFFNTTPIGLTLIVASMIALVTSLVRYFIDWMRGGDRISFAFTLSLVLWVSALVLLLILNSVLQIMEILWYSMIPIGLAILALAMLMSSVIEPHRALKDLVDNRTIDLQRSEKESQFYLNMWSHKVGNLLQGLITFIELSEMTEEKGLDGKTISDAYQLSRQATLVNRQVASLGRIKRKQSVALEPRRLIDAIQTAHQDAANLLADRNLEITTDVGSDTFVLADELLDLLFLSLFIHARKFDNTENIDISCDVGDDSVAVDITAKCEWISPATLKQILDDDIPTSSQLGLEVHTIKLLLSRYGCTLERLTSKNTSESTVRVVFRKTDEK